MAPSLGRRLLRGVSTALIGTSSALCFSATFGQTAFIEQDRFIPHTSTVSANAGERVPLFVHEKLSRATADAIARGESPAEVVLFIHGGSVPSVPDYDLPFKDYSWMEYLAVEGFDTFSMDQTGYGLSQRPAMDDACNLSAANQALVMPNPLPEACEPSYTGSLTSFASDWDEIDTVVDFIRDLRGVETIHLIGWSMGGARAGGYAAAHPDKIANLILFAPFYNRNTVATATGNNSGPPMQLQTRERLMNERWRDLVVCENQIDPGIQDVIWQSIMSFDSLGSIWGPEHGVMRYPTYQLNDWTRDVVGMIDVPTLVLVGTEDSLLNADRDLFADLTLDHKVLVEMDCATHMAVWEETQYKFMHEASLDWLQDAQYRGETSGTYAVGVYGAPRDR